MRNMNISHFSPKNPKRKPLESNQLETFHIKTFTNTHAYQENFRSKTINDYVSLPAAKVGSSKMFTHI
jgi:hypothetical protein